MVAAVLPQPGLLFVVHLVEVCGLNVAGVDSNFVHVGNELALDGRSAINHCVHGCL